MSKKKSDDFTSSPFKSLKGLSLPVKEEIKPPVLAPRHEVAGEYDFAVEMKGLGVKTLPPDERLVFTDRPKIEPSVAVTPVVTAALTEEALFLQAIAGMEVIFTDEIPDLEVPSATPRRMKLVEQGRLRPADRLDLHGYSRSEARSRVTHFLENSLHHRHELVLIITGWGKHGSGEAILREEIMRFLRTDGASLISEWALAPKNLGGDGALLVFPRRNQKKV